MAVRSRFAKGARGLLLVLGILIALLLLYIVLAPLLGIGGVTTPAAQGPLTVRLDQGWNGYDSLRFHHSTQGSRILPLSWFMALEQPVFTPLPVGLLAERDYMGRFGFMYETERPAAVKSGVLEPTPKGAPAKDPYAEAKLAQDDFDLPLGFAIHRNFKAPYADPPVSTETPVVGLTCAGCHTGRLDVKLEDGTLKSVMIEGGSAMIHITNFQQAVGRALFFTQFFKERFRRFARAALGESLPDDNPRILALKKDLDRFIELGLASEDYAKEHKLNSTLSGYSRTDALGLIGNRVFGVLNQENQVVTDAPVNFPHLWDTPWFDWVQYNGSIRTPMARNIGEALGVGAVINLKDPLKPTDPPLYESSVHLANLSWMEDALGGDEPFQGLQPPSWADMARKVFGNDPPAGSPYAINREMAEAGEKLYKANCVRCHLPPHKTLTAVPDRSHSEYFSKPDPGSGKHFLRLNVVGLNVIGTDPNQALNFYRRVATAPEPPTRAYSNTDDDAAQQRVDYAKQQAVNENYAYWSRLVRQATPNSSSFAMISAEDGLFRVTSMIRRLQYQSQQYQLLPPKLELQKLLEHHEGDIQRAGAGLVVVAFVGDALYCRVFDVDGVPVIDRSERDVKTPPARLAALKQSLKAQQPGSLPVAKYLGEIAAVFFPDQARFFDEKSRTEQRKRWDRYRAIPAPLDLGDERAILEAAGKDWVIMANLGYRARPHDGIWATPPFLHNGSVPNLYEMLVPAKERSPKFYLGSTRFDPVRVGYESSQFHGGFEMDTSLPGNTNVGHEFRNFTLEDFEYLKGTPPNEKSTLAQRWCDVLGIEETEYHALVKQDALKALITKKTHERLDEPGPRAIKGVIGAEFTDDERWRLVEYLKTL
ncbi:di-heme-cytochrome C peroxidase [Paludisphaera rhizosphaerae]|uniref:di-heme-cytochrome C peroxidase n=1 Tax=Paludisphaera rhizosphaerae TaxID=2711216 RepID=UPI0013EB2F1E|nr:di-heme-cytochrome C peroxidase [Paludisphaera rhizosphaerae]